MTDNLRVLHVEDSESDAELIARSLEKTGFHLQIERVEDSNGMRAALRTGAWDVVLCDYRLPGFDAHAALSLLHETGLDLPFIVVSGTVGEDSAVAIMKSGAHDYVLKDNLARLAPAIKREITEAGMREDRRLAQQDLRLALLEAQARESLLHAVFATQTDAVVVFDLDRAVIRANPAAHALFGDDMTGLRLFELLARLEIRDGTAQSATERAFDGEVIAGVEQRAGERAFEISAAAMRDERNSISGVVSIWRDIQDRKRAEARSRRADRLESIGVLAGGIAHSFNNILTAVGGNISLALEDIGPNAAVRPILTTAMEAVQRAAGLTHQLLAYAGKSAFTRERVFFHDIVAQSLASLRQSVSARIVFRTEVSRYLPPVFANPAQLRQVIVNLVLNSIEAIEPEAGTITIRAGIFDDAIRLTVADTGRGIPEAAQSRIFEPFFTTKFAGRGLGLAAVEGIARSLSGTVSVESAPGEGTWVQLTIPMAHSRRHAAPVLPASLPSGAAAVLLIDDEPLIRNIAFAFLATRGILCLEAASPSEAIECLSAHSASIGAVLLGLPAPGSAGNRVLAEIYRLRPDIPVVLSSAFNQADLQPHFRTRSVRGFLPKPYSAADLLAHILPLLEVSHDA